MNQSIEELISEARRAGVELALMDNRVCFRSAGSLALDLRERLKEHEADLVDALRASCPRDSKKAISQSKNAREPRAARAFVAGELRRLRAAGLHEDAIEARYRWRERAAICEYDGGLPREEAESIAAADLGALDHPGAGLVPDGWTRER